MSMNKVKEKSMLKTALRTLLRVLYRVEIIGLDNYANAGKRVLIVANHTSFLDPLLLGVFLPDNITFAINTQISQRWWLKPFLQLSKVFPMDPTHPLSLKNLIHYLEQDTHTVIFPEGRISVTGALMKIYDGTGMVADKTNATILPIRIAGAQYTHFSKLHRIVRLRLFPKITIHISTPTQLSAPSDIKGKARRAYCGHLLSDIMSNMMFDTSQYQHAIFTGLLEARKIHGGDHKITEDLDRSVLTYDDLVTRSIALGHALTKITTPTENVGVFLPNSSKTLMTVLGLQLHSRIPAMLNYSMGANNLLSACHTATIKTVITSHRFIELGHLQEEAQQLSQVCDLIYLEDLAKTISTPDKILARIKSATTALWYNPKSLDPNSPAVILFTSGSEGTPKGVVLSHTNILGNLKQLEARISFNARDVVLNFLPMFHSFGFTVGTILPIMSGMRTFFYPTPLHFSVIPEIAYEIHATIMFGTNTFFAAYAKKAHPYDFFNLRYVVAGAEKLQEPTRQIWADKFGIRILEGYGATETSPITSVNTPLYHKMGTVGRFLPRMNYQLEPIPGIEKGGQLHVSGPNIMLGYILTNNPGKIVPPESKYGLGWHDTGDIVEVDNEGFISIQGRSKRFAKIGGEMVSLVAVEQLAINKWPEAHHAVVSIPDLKKGELIILITTQKPATITDLVTASPGISNLSFPKKILIVDAIPTLMTGKVNYPEVIELAKQVK